jgi:hypothetical protein
LLVSEGLRHADIDDEKVWDGLMWLSVRNLPLACACKHESQTLGTKMWRISVLAELILGSQGRFSMEFNELHLSKITLPRTVCIEIL